MNLKFLAMLGAKFSLTAPLLSVLEHKNHHQHSRRHKRGCDRMEDISMPWSCAQGFDVSPLKRKLLMELLPPRAWFAQICRVVYPLAAAFVMSFLLQRNDDYKMKYAYCFRLYMFAFMRPAFAEFHG
jgi:hypothetical protein